MTQMEQVTLVTQLEQVTLVTQLEQVTLVSELEQVRAIGHSGKTERYLSSALVSVIYIYSPG